MSSTDQNTRNPSRVGPPWSADLGGVVAAVVCALVTWGSARLAGVEPAVERGGEVQEIGGAAVALVAGASALVGLTALRLLERSTSRALRLWTGLAAVVTLVSLLGPLSATTTAATGTLLSLHAVVAAVVIASAHASRRRRSID
ncbi:MAG TPA: DUF6069 family protein [Marmoricola sp.]|nr:DUF6069 family protein [Marmoricola sp.]